MTMTKGVTVDQLYEIGAFLPSDELEKASQVETKDGSTLSAAPFVSQALKQYQSVLLQQDKKDTLSLLPTPQGWWQQVQSTIPQSAPQFQQEISNFLSTGRSNGRALRYTRMCIAPHQSFVLHAHPNIEVIYIVHGTLYERRFRPEYLSPDEKLGEVYGTDLSSCPPEALETHSYTQGQVLLNEIGSVHRSYTLEQEAELFVLWGAKGHCDVPFEFTPPSERHPLQQTQPHSNKPSSGNCSTWIANALVDAGVKVVYGGHGGALAPLVSAVVEHPGLHWVCCRNEANASLMAAANAKYTGHLACVIATSGPGATNLTTGLMESVLDQVPVLCLTGLKPRQGMHYSEFQDVDQSRLFAAGGVEFSFDVASPEALIPLLRDAVAVATTRNTCAHLAIPVDIQAAPCPIPVDKPFCAARADQRIAPSKDWLGAQESVLDDIVRILSVDTKKVLIAIGLRAVHAGDDILKLAEHLRAPIVTRLHAKGAVDELHPLVLGVEGIHGKPGMVSSAALMETADIVLNFGVADASLLVCNTAGLQVREMIDFETTALMVNTRFRAIHTCLGDISTMARALLKRFQNTGGRRFSDLKALRVSLGTLRSSIESTASAGTIPSEDDDEAKEERLIEAQIGAIDVEKDGMSEERMERAAKLWNAVHGGGWRGKRHNLDTLKAAENRNHINRNGTRSSQFAHPASVLMEVSRHLTKETVTCIDTGDVTLWAGLCLKLEGGSRTLSSERLGTMGYSLCAGIASVLSREAPATSLVLAGDGGFQMTLQELATFQQHKRPGDRLIVIVLDNQLLGRVIFGFDGALGCELKGPDFCELAKAYGGDGHRLHDAVKVGEHVRDAKEGLTILHIPIDPSLKADMATFKDGATKMMNSG